MTRNEQVVAVVLGAFVALGVVATSLVRALATANEAERARARQLRLEEDRRRIEQEAARALVRERESERARAAEEAERKRKTARRTPETDATFASAEPLANGFRPLPGSEGGDPPVWAGEGLVAAARQGTSWSLLVWREPATPPTPVPGSKGRVIAIAGSSGPWAAIQVVESKDPDEEKNDDPVSISLLGLERCELVELVRTSAMQSPGGPLLWSPKGDLLALQDRVARKNVARVYDARSQKLAASTDASKNFKLLSWTGGGVVLERTLSDSTQETVHRYLWSPGRGDPKLSSANAGVRSPDGKFRLRSVENALEIESDEGLARFEPTNASDRRALGELGPDSLPWIGGHGLVLAAEETVVLDLATAKLSYLLPPGFRFESASADGRNILARDAEGRLVWAPAR
ncbi:hypothetical protein HY251_21180 [bacterium]|nr:hypothetical protein [bacterium]